LQGHFWVEQYPARAVCCWVLNLLSQVKALPGKFRLGRSLSRRCREIGPFLVGVGSERRCSIARTAGHFSYTI